MYLLDVLSSDKTSEITSLISLNSSYQSLPSRLPSNLTSLILKTALAHHTHRFFNPTYAGLISSITSKPPSSRESSGMIPTIQDTRNPPAFAIPPCESEDTLTLRSQYVRFLPPPPSSPPARDEYLTMVEEVLGKFWSTEKDKGRDEEWRRTGSGGMDGTERDWVYLVTPFVCCLTRPMAVFLGFQRLVERLGAFLSPLGLIMLMLIGSVEGFPSMPSRLASLLTLFRLTLPELWSYFGDEQVPYVQIAMSWLQTMLAKEMWLGDVLRLWGTSHLL